MQPNTRRVIEQIMHALYDSIQDIDLDSGDCRPTMISEEEYCFKNYRYINQGFGREAKPIGEIVYTLTLKGEYIPYKDE